MPGVAGVQLHQAKPRAMNIRGSPAVPQPLVVPLFNTRRLLAWSPSIAFAPALTHNGIQGWSLETG